MDTYLHVGGLVAVGFDPAGAYLLTVTHSGRGVFSTRTWERVARDPAVVYPLDGTVKGIGPLAEQLVSVTAMGFTSGPTIVTSPNGTIVLDCESSGISVRRAP